MKEHKNDVKQMPNINHALNRYITRKLFESRIMELPEQALARTSFSKNPSIFRLKRHTLSN